MYKHGIVGNCAIAIPVHDERHKETSSLTHLPLCHHQRYNGKAAWLSIEPTRQQPIYKRSLCGQVGTLSAFNDISIQPRLLSGNVAHH